MLLSNEPMSKHCSLRAGGIAKKFFIPSNIYELSSFLKNNKNNILMLGLGSNLLVRDCGFDGVVIKLNKLKDLSIKKTVVYAQAGITLAKLSKFCSLNKLIGAEFLSTIPGSVGGALSMNAGAFGNDIWDLITQVKTINSQGVIYNRDKSNFKVDYRSVILQHKDEYFIAAKLNFKQTIKKQSIEELLKKRRKTQPIGQINCGSVFKNPPNEYAAKLIEKSNLKGFCIGNVCVSRKHANFIVNKNNANASDIEKLIIHIQKIVKLKFNINLEKELKII